MEMGNNMEEVFGMVQMFNKWYLFLLLIINSRFIFDFYFIIKVIKFYALNDIEIILIIKGKNGNLRKMYRNVFVGEFYKLNVLIEKQGR